MYKTEKAETHDEHLALKRKGFDHSPYNKKKCGPYKKRDHTNTKCWPGCSPKSGTPKTKMSSKTGLRVNNCDCNK